VPGSNGLANNGFVNGHGALNGSSNGAYANPPADAIMLYVPGQLLHIQRSGTDASATYKMVRGGARQSFQRILVHRSMLRDHYLNHYEAALQHLLEQLPAAAEEAAAGAPAAAAAPQPAPAV
jgi:hypothetical protein